MWQYKIVTPDEMRQGKHALTPEEVLNTMGQRGWEHYLTDHDGSLYFKKYEAPSSGGGY